MKCKTVIWFSFFLLIFVFTSGIKGHAETETNLEELDPNVYEEKELKENTEYLHEESLYEKRTTIPEEQKDLTFEKPSRDEKDDLQEQLFTNYTKEKNTIKSKAEQLDLFSGSAEPSLSMTETVNSDTTQNSGLMMTYILLIAIGVILMIGLLIPKMTQSKKTD
ncbi:type VII secretion protein EssA [Peribacillus frigoritolerans]|uniref:type VII secretion protein EssA n=1 Tax=Peribacillus frigoritolerans TaxID=450367 RepID=UPI001404ECDB|nr:type VII secretion protein EssA [Peribacillus frigoritolerans]